MTVLRSTGPLGLSPRLSFGSLLAAVAAVSVLAGSHGSSSTTVRHETTTYSVRGRVRTLVVTAHVGDVQVTGGATGVVSVVQHLVYQGALPTTRHRLAAGSLSLTSQCGVDQVCTISYDITVPKATAVRVTDDLGTVQLTALAGQVAATVDAGKIELSSLSGQVRAATRAGSIIGRDISSQRVGLRVFTGEIDIFFSVAASAISATTEVGAVILHVPNNVSYHVITSAGVGHVSVSVSENTAAPRTITTRTEVGSITIEPAP